MTFFNRLFLVAALLVTSVGAGVHEKLAMAYQQGDINYIQYLENHIHYFSQDGLLAEEFSSKSVEPVKCYTNLMVDIKKNMDKLSPDAQASANKLFARPSMQNFYDTPGGNFRIHYDISGTDAVLNPSQDTNPADGIPDYVNRAADYCDYVWQKEVDEMGFVAPPSDGFQGGNSRYDIYLKHYSGAYGVTFSESIIGNPNPFTSTSYIFMDPTFAGFPNTPEENLQVTAAHEFHHAIQMTYDVYESSWYKEISSTWVEDIVYDDVDDYYNYLSGFYGSPEVSITVANGWHEYASCIFNHYLSQTHGDTIVLDIWQNLVGSNHNEVLSVLNTRLPDYNSTLPNAFAEFTTWNYLTGNRRTASPVGYEEGAAYPFVAMARTHSVFPVEAQYPTSGLPDYYGSNYIRFSSLPADGSVLIGFEGLNTVNWAVTVIAKRDGVYEYQTPVTSEKSAFAVVRDAAAVSEIVLIPAVTSFSGNDNPFTYYARGFASDTLFLMVEDDAVIDSVVGNYNGRLEQGEEAEYYLTLKNFGEQVDNVEMRLISNTPGVHLTNDVYTFTTIAGQSSVTNDIPVMISCDDTVSAERADFSLEFSLGGEVVLTDQVSLLIGITGLLIVDDDAGSTSEMQLLNDLDELGKVYDVQVIDVANLPALDFTSRELVIWHFGNLGKTSQFMHYKADIEAYLDNGGDMIMAGSAFWTGITDTTFLYNYLNLTNRRVSPTQLLRGEADDPIGNNQYLSLTVAGAPQVDLVNTDRNEPSFKFLGQTGYGAYRHNYGYKLVFFTFGFNDILNDNASFLTSETVLSRTLDWFTNTATGIEEPAGFVPSVTTLYPNYPNPFNPTTMIRFDLEKSGPSELAIYDLLGRKIKTLVSDNLAAGSYRLQWDGTNAAGEQVGSGVYFYRLTGDALAMTRKMILVR